MVRSGSNRGNAKTWSDERAIIRSRRADEIGLVAASHDARFVLACASPYRAGMSSLGMQTLYRRLNDDGVATHRAFLPDDWEPAALPWPQPPQAVLSYEDERPLASYPVIGISVAYELEIAGVIRLLSGGGVPLLASERGPRDPIVIGGGPLTFSNPTCLLPFVDVLIMGEAEDILPAVLDAIAGAGNRTNALDAASRIPHTMLGQMAADETVNLPEVAKASEPGLPARSAILTPHTELSNMFLIEPERGCSRRCTFCVMRGSTNGGMRLNPVDQVLSLIPEQAQRVGLVGAAVTDHPDINELVTRIVDSGRGIGISSLRADKLTPEFLTQLARGGYRTITVASDGISERMRKVLQRKITEQHLLHAAQLIRDHGFHRMKLYQMIGAPGETDDDCDELIRFARELAKLVRLTLTISTFVAKRNTPLDGHPFLGVKQAEARLARVRAGLKGRVELRPQPPKWAYVEYLLAQHGVEGGRAAIHAVQAGGRYSDWLRAFTDVPPRSLAIRTGEETAWARRTGKAAAKAPTSLNVI